MKGIAATLAALEGNAQPLSQEGAEGEESACGEGFDALLALVNAQAPNGPGPVKVLAPSVGVQCAPVAAGKDPQTSAAPAPTPKSVAHSALDLAPTHLFLPWLGTQAEPLAPVVTEAPAASSTSVEGEDAQAAVAAQLAPLTSEVVAVQGGQDATPAVLDAPLSARTDAPETPLSEPVLKGAHKGALAQRKPSARPPEAQGEQADMAAVSSSALQNVVASQFTPAVPSTSNAQLSAPSAAATAVNASAQKRAPASVAPAIAPSAAVEQELAPPVAFAELPSGDAVEPTQLQREPATLGRAATTAAQVTLPLVDAETNARVTKIEFFSSAEAPAVSEPLPTEPQPIEHGLEREQLESAPGESHEQSASGEQTSADPRTPNEQAASGASSATGSARFEVTEGKGMRGLDAVVASLLRPYAEKPEGAGGARVPTARVTHISVETGKSQNVKLEERVANVSQALDSAALRRQEEERRGELRELTEPAPLHFSPQLGPEADLPVEAQPTQNSAPVNVPAPPPDPDAALMGKLARGESLNAAVSIEHPELGSMDVLVQNQNGRIDVRATLETPRAAAVLRAHESALRYGVQQAGMTFGALRVNARTGEAKIEKSRDVPKRRRERDWEA